MRKVAQTSYLYYDASGKLCKNELEALINDAIQTQIKFLSSITEYPEDVIKVSFFPKADAVYNRILKTMVDMSGKKAIDSDASDNFIAFQEHINSVLLLRNYVAAIMTSSKTFDDEGNALFPKNGMDVFP